MRRSDTETIPAREVTREVETTCDLCKVAKGKPDDRAANEWARGYDTVTTSVSIDAGTRYPGSSRGEVVAVDICPDCFRKKLLPWLESQGATARKGEYDY